ncbi:MAG: histidine phosphatase family protein [Hyphomonadaceae bacterium]|nr:histidine phosphatase family protein [Hyphomonadaceae bacterium]
MGLLILLRHSKAEREHEAPSDRARALTGRGRSDAAAAAIALREAAVTIGAVLASSAVRTRETAGIVRDALNLAAPVTLLDRLYLAEPDVIWAAARGAVGDGAMVVGHNPGLHALVASFIDRSGDRSSLARGFLQDFPTAAWAAFDADNDDLESVAPRFLGGWSPKI